MASLILSSSEIPVSSSEHTDYVSGDYFALFQEGV